ncbi:PilZ domain-containing protein [Aestuariispira ectoiniformans]|uniref:PilZ domain-containing protein n=1 Tax=Aestuariispira ectoiniformans TaxID=2775080 RepID=UPI00223BA689|nr:PilZ domain-containing protein [Aestuariispira ectoiniformans]
MVGPTRLIRITATGDRRKDKRVSGISLPATVDDVKGTIVNISLGGVSFLAEKAALKNGHEAAVTIQFSDCDLEIPVRIIAHEDDTKQEYGLSFLGLDRKAFDRIQRAVTNPYRGM